MGKPRVLLVRVECGTHLTNRKSRVPGAISDPYVVVCLDGDGGAALARTKVVRNSLSPRWAAGLRVEAGRAAAGRAAPPTLLTFVVMDSAGIGSDKEMGRAALPLAALREAGAWEGALPVSTGGTITVAVATSGAAKRASGVGSAAGPVAGATSAGVLVAGLAAMAASQKKKKKQKQKRTGTWTGWSGSSAGRYGTGGNGVVRTSGRDSGMRREEEGWWESDSDSSDSGSSSGSGSGNGSGSDGGDSSSGSSSSGSSSNGGGSSSDGGCSDDGDSGGYSDGGDSGGYSGGGSD